MVPAFRTLVLEPGGPPALAGAPALLNARWPGGAWPARLRRIGAAGLESPAGDAAAGASSAAAGPVCPPPAGPRADADAVLAAMLGWLRQAVGCDAARALAYDPEAMLPVAFASGDERRWDEEAAACWMAFAEADAAQFALLSTSGAKVALRTAEPAAAPGPGWAALWRPAAGAMSCGPPLPTGTAALVLARRVPRRRAAVRRRARGSRRPRGARLRRAAVARHRGWPGAAAAGSPGQPVAQ